MVRSTPRGSERLVAQRVEYAKDDLLEWIARNPWAYQDEKAEFLYEEWDLWVHRRTISRFLKEHRISHKVSALVRVRVKFYGMDGSHLWLIPLPSSLPFR